MSLSAIALERCAIVVVGAGTMGVGIAQVAAMAGHDVRVIDLDPVALERGRVALEAGLAALVRRGAIDEMAKATLAAGVHWSTDLAEAAGAVLAIEAVVERLDVKTALFTQLAKVMGEEAILASNTSSLSISELALSVPFGDRFMGLHFFNPVPVMKLVEVIAAPGTNSGRIDAVVRLMQAWGKRPVLVRDVPGFIVNRVARPYYAEGFAALGEEIDPAVIDAALTGAGGFRMGALALADMIGQDVNYAVATSVYEAYEGKTRFRPQLAQQALVQSGKLGRKSGQGVYSYDASLPSAPVEAQAPAPSIVSIPKAGSLFAPLIDAVRSAGLAIQVNPALDPASLRVDGVRLALGDGRPLADRADVDILIDWARDFEKAQSIVFTARDDQAAGVAAGFVQAIGRSALRVPDRPGQIVLRVLAQLANAAADAVADSVASAKDIDEAMIFGANHPEGPMTWAARVGYPTVSLILANIAAATEDALYGPAPLFSSHAKDQHHG